MKRKPMKKLSAKYSLVGWQPDYVIEGILSDLGAGMRPTKVAAKHGVNRSNVRRYFRKAVRHGYLSEDCQPIWIHPSQHVTEAQIADMLELIRAGASDYTTGRLVGRSKNTVRHYREKAGLTSNDSRRFYQADEIEALLALRSNGITFPEIAARLGRPVHSVTNKYYQLARRGLNTSPKVNP